LRDWAINIAGEMGISNFQASGIGLQGLSKRIVLEAER
jgi:hypothetical protein